MYKEKSIVHLSIFFLKETITRRDQIIKDGSFDGPAEIAITGSAKGYLYWNATHPHYPKWTSLFADYMDIKQIGKTTGISALFLLKEEGRYFALTFGQGGRFLIEDDVWEERFGLLVALNSVARESFRCVDKQSLDAIQSHTRIQSGQETTADQFGLDVEQDMLKAIVGAPQDPRLGTRMTGTDSLSVSVRTGLSDLPFLLKSYKEKYEQDLSNTDYEWVNNISSVKNSSALVTALEERLIEKFTNNDYSNLWLAVPEIIDWNLVSGFMYSGGKGILNHDIKLDGFLFTLNGQPVSIDLLKRRRVLCSDADHKPVFKHWPVYKCLYAEIDHEGKKFILNDGKWFNVSVNFVKRTDAEFGKIDISLLQLPVYTGGGEGKYNKDICDSYPTKFALLDDKNKISHGGGHGQVEVCDLFSINKELVHVKIYGKSSVFSHLFSQGFVSGQLLQVDAEFRKKVKAKLAPPFSDLIDADRPKEKELTVVFAVISDSPERTLHLPFFSRVNLNNTCKVLNGLGFNVQLLKVEVDSIYAKTKKCPPQV
jgi:uncharacterized protein (TIGR04141 family)